MNKILIFIMLFSFSTISHANFGDEKVIEDDSIEQFYDIIDHMVDWLDETGLELDSGLEQICDDHLFVEDNFPYEGLNCSEFIDEYYTDIEENHY